jgi:hypothetical protein
MFSSPKNFVLMQSQIKFSLLVPIINLALARMISTELILWKTTKPKQFTARMVKNVQSKSFQVNGPQSTIRLSMSSLTTAYVSLLTSATISSKSLVRTHTLMLKAVELVDSAKSSLVTMKSLTHNATKQWLVLSRIYQARLALVVLSQSTVFNASTVFKRSTTILKRLKPLILERLSSTRSLNTSRLPLRTSREKSQRPQPMPLLRSL